MNFSPSNQPHTLHFFDRELINLDKNISKLFQFIITQIELSERNIDNHDSQFLRYALDLENEIISTISNIDHEVLKISAKFSPVANDLKSVLSTSKATYRLSQINLDTMDFIKVINDIFSQVGKSYSTDFIEIIIEMSRYIRFILTKLKIGIIDQNIDYLFEILEEDIISEEKIKEKLSHETQGFVTERNKIAVQNSISINHLIYSISREIKHLTIDYLESILSDNGYRHEWISNAAYYIAEHRHFIMDSTLSDWIEAENAFITGPLERLKTHNSPSNQ